MRVISEHRCYDGVQGFYRHVSTVTGTPMRFSVYQPPQAKHQKVPVLFYLAGLTCTEETFMIKANAQRFVTTSDLLFGKYLLLRKGKRNYTAITVTS